MKYIIKFYDWIYWDIKLQRDDFSLVDIKKDISDVSTGKIILPIFEWLSHLDRVDICMNDDLDTVIFSGVIRTIWVESDSENIAVNITWMKCLLQRKHIKTDITTTSFTTLINTVVSQWATLGETLTVDIEEEFTIENDTHSKWKSIYDILADVCSDKYAFDFDALLKIISVRKTLWTEVDKVYTFSNYHLDNNIAKVSLIQDENIRNLSMNIDWGTQSEVEWYSKEKYWLLSFDSTNKDTQWILKDFSLSILEDELSAWDSLTVEILGNTYIEYYGFAYVVRENLTITQSGITKEVEVSNIISKEKTLTNLINLALKK